MTSEDKQLEQEQIDPGLRASDGVESVDTLLVEELQKIPKKQGNASRIL